MRLLLVALLLGSGAGCGARGPQGLSWPKASTSETDGGESIAPRQPAVAAVEAGAEVEEEEDKPASATPVSAVPAPPAAATSAAAAPAASLPEEPITTEEIVIEVED